MGNAHADDRALCACGSGKPSAECCGKRQERLSDGGYSLVPDDMLYGLQGQFFATLDEAQAYLDVVREQYNKTPCADFQGLSPEQMYHFLYYPFDSPQFVTFSPCPATASDAPIMKLFALLVEAIGDKGLKPTATGNLPQKVLRDAALTYLGEEQYQKHTRFGAIRTERDFADLHVTRLIAELGGLVRKYKGKFILSRDCRTLMAKHGIDSVYPRLMKAFIQQYNWAYLDSYPEIPLIQHSFLFSLFLLHRFGDQWRKDAFYEDAFLQAFPHVIEEVEPRPYGTSERNVRTSYSIRCLDRFATFLGLVELRRESDSFFERRFSVKKLPLLDAAVQFTL